MAGARQIKWYFRSTVSPVTGNWTLSETIGGATQVTTTTHTGNGTTNTFQILKPGVTQGTTSNTSIPTTAPPAVANQFGWFSDTAYTGTFEAGVWNFQYNQTDTTTINGFPNITVFKCTAQSFSSTWTFLFNTASGTSWWTNNTGTANFNSASQSVITLNNEFLFCQVWCNEVTTTTGKSHQFKMDGSTETALSKFTSPVFVPLGGFGQLNMMGMGM